MRSLANPVVGYVGAVLGVIAIASIAVFNLHGMAAKAHRHWDADIDRIIAQQQAKKLDTVVLARADIPNVSDAGPWVAALTRDAIEDDEDDLAFTNEEGVKSKKLQNPGSKKNSRRAERQHQHYIPAAFLTLPKFAASAAATTTTTLLKPR
jgi:hypothetical protein